MEYRGIIYRVTNQINGKLYIGQSINGGEVRWKGHLREKRDYLFSRAIKKYGKENFLVEEIDEAYCPEELNRLERYWIKSYRANEPEFGYNMTIGGDSAQLSRSYRLKRAKYFVHCIETDKIFAFPIDAERETGISSATILNVLRRGSGTAGGYHWRKLDVNATIPENVIIHHFAMTEKARKANCREVSCIETGEIFSTLSALARKLGLRPSRAWKLINEGRPLLGLTYQFIAPSPRFVVQK